MKHQIKGYESDTKLIENDDEIEEQDENDVETNNDNNNDEKESFSIAMTDNKQNNESDMINFILASGNSNNKSNSMEFESSGDGEDDNDSEAINQNEYKNAYIPIPNNYDGSSIVNAQLHRLSQLIQSVNNDNNYLNDIEPEYLNKFLAAHRQKFGSGYFDRFSNNKNAIPIPSNGIIDNHHMDQILGLQHKINNLAITKDQLSTPQTPIEFTVSGNGVFPGDATTVHIKASNKFKNPRLPDPGYASSQIVVNRPGGSIIFRLPNYHQSGDKNAASQISEGTLKRLLSLSEKMSNHAPNTPHFVHDHPNGYYPVIQPVIYNFPWNELTALLSALQAKKGDQSMDRISAVNGVMSTSNPHTVTEEDDAAPATVVNNHIPITISNPTPSNSIMNRFHVSTTPHPITQDNYDSYGNKYDDYPLYPPHSAYNNGNTVTHQLPPVGTPVASYSSAYPTTFSMTDFKQNLEQPQFIQIAQSRPEHYVSPYNNNDNSNNNNNNAIVNHLQKPVPTYASINGYTQKIYSPYTPTPHLNDKNINNFVQIESNAYPTNYVPITSSASNTNPSYLEPSTIYSQHSQKYSVIADKIDQFDDDSDETEENIENDSFDESNENDESDRLNLEQININNDNSNENVMNLLTNFNSQQQSMERITNAQKHISSHEHHDDNHKRYVNFNGNIMSVETYQQSIEPYIKANALSNVHVELLTCATGVRQANTTDCTRYFVCNAKNGKILSYSCPPYTAFNQDTKICNAEKYSRCYPDAVKNKFTSGSSKLIEQQTLIEANRIKAEALKAQQLAQLIKLETEKLLNSASTSIRLPNRIPNNAKATTLPVSPTRPSNIFKKPTEASNSVKQSATKKKHHSVRKPQGKRKIPCHSEGKLTDKLSKFHYFLCYKDSFGKMRARRLQCPAQLIFCEQSLVCTQTERCMNKLNRL